MLFSVLTWILEEHDVLAAAPIGLVPLAIGVGFLIDYQLQKRDLSRYGLEVRSAEGMPPLHAVNVFGKISPCERLSPIRGR